MNVSLSAYLNLLFKEYLYLNYLKWIRYVNKNGSKFSSMISSDQINQGQIQLYVDTLAGGNSFNNKQGYEVNQVKSPFLSKIKRESGEQSPNTFNPSKTFGGQRARLIIKEYQQSKNQGDSKNYNLSKDFSNDKQDGFTGLTTQAILPILEKLFKNFNDNQIKMQKGIPLTNPVQPQYQPKIYYN